jgi:tetratricopeptide (TPR) repeat protein
MPLPSRADLARSSFTIVWLVLAVATLSWKAPWFWTRAPIAPSASATAQATDPEPPSVAPVPRDLVAPPPETVPHKPASPARRDVVRATPIAFAATDRQAPAVGDETLEAARARHEALVRERPTDPDRLRALARVYEASQSFEEALGIYGRLESLPGALTADDQLHVARLLRWTRQPSPAVTAYERYLALAGPAATPDASGELALALADSGRYEEALPLLDAAIARSSSDTDLYVALARAADALGQPGRAAAALVGLASLRTLTGDEAMWLAGQLEESGHIDPGLPALHAALAADRSNTALWERLGDLEWTRGQYADALAAYERVPEDCAHGDVLVKRARSAARVGRFELAARRYQQAGDCAPDNADLTLETARFHGSTKQFDAAVLAYERYAAQATPSRDVALEITQTALAAERPDLALAWADAASARGDRSPSLDYARAQALHLLNRPAEASAVLASVARDRPGDGTVFAWQGRAAFAQGRHLAAYRLFDSALTRGAAGRAEILVARGDAAGARGDISRASASYEAARRATQNPEALDLDVRELELRRRTVPELVVPAEVFRDSNGVALTQAGTDVALWLFSAVRLRAGWSAGRVEQSDYGFRRRAFFVHASEIFPTPAMRLELGAGVEDYGTITLPVWQARARRDLESGGHLGIDVARHTPWSDSVRLGSARYNRISDLQTLGPSFHATGIRGEAELPMTGQLSLRADGGWRRYSDSNQQLDLYVHVQREVTARPDGSLWVAIQPQVYLERWARLEPAYYSPDRHVSAGVGLRAQASRRSWALDGTVAPQIIASDGTGGFGLFSSASIRRKVGLVWLGGEAAIFDDRRSSYRLRRFAAEVRIPFGR